MLREKLMDDLEWPN